MRALVAGTLLLCGACIDDGGSYVYGTNLSEMELVITGPTMAVHPDTSILEVDDNPFLGGVGEVRWTTLGEAKYIPAFYAWGTALAQIPEGERQYYAAFCAHQIYDLRLAEPGDDVWVRQIAIGGYTSVLDNFPDVVTFNAEGTFSYRLAPLAYQGIVDLGGTPPSGWVQIETANGTDVVKP